MAYLTTFLREFLESGVFHDLLVALIVVAATFLVNTLLEEHKARLSYRQKLAERTVQSYWEMIGILQTQAFRIASISQAFDDVASGRVKPDYVERARNSINAEYRQFAKAYREEQPRLLQNVIFITGGAQKPLLEHQQLVKKFSGLMEGPLTDDAIAEISALDKRIGLSLANLQWAMMEEMSKPGLRNNRPSHRST
jgi:hypothetical protein